MGQTFPLKARFQFWRMKRLLTNYLRSIDIPLRNMEMLVWLPTADQPEEAIVIRGVFQIDGRDKYFNVLTTPLEDAEWSFPRRWAQDTFEQLAWYKYKVPYKKGRRAFR